MDKKTLTLFKIGGNSIDNPQALEAFLNDFTACESPKILVHGGGVLAGELAKKLGIPVQMHEGRRITDAQTLQVVTMVYAGWINKTLVAALNARGCKSIGLCGADNSLFTSTKRAPTPIDFGFVGDMDAESVNAPFLCQLLRNGITPVCCSITCTSDGQLLNTNADTVASSVSRAMRHYFQTRLIFVFDKAGVLYPGVAEALPLLSKKQYQQMKEQGYISGGMIPKLDNAFAALEQGIEQVYVGNTRIQQ